LQLLTVAWRSSVFKPPLCFLHLSSFFLLRFCRTLDVFKTSTCALQLPARSGPLPAPLPFFITWLEAGFTTILPSQKDIPLFPKTGTSSLEAADIKQSFPLRCSPVSVHAIVLQSTISFQPSRSYELELVPSLQLRTLSFFWYCSQRFELFF